MARQVAMMLCLEMLHGASLPLVGRAFNRDHTTVLHARDSLGRRIAVSRKFAKEVEELRQVIRRAA